MASAPASGVARVPSPSARSHAMAARREARSRRRARSTSSSTDTSYAMASPSQARSGTFATSRPPKIPAGVMTPAPVTTTARRRDRRDRRSRRRRGRTRARCPFRRSRTSSTARRESRAPRRVVTWRSGHSGSGSSRPPVGGTMPFAIAIAVIVASIAPAAARVCPNWPFWLETGTRATSLAEHAHEGARLHRVVQRRAGPVRVDVVDVGRPTARRARARHASRATARRRSARDS